MPRTDEAEAFFHAVYSAVQEIPYGKVTSYGHIAKLVGTRMFPPLTPLSYSPNHSYTTTPLSLHHATLPTYMYSSDTHVSIGTHMEQLSVAQRPRQVGVCLKHLPSQTDQPSARFHNDNVPWQRVINAKGVISPRYEFFSYLPS